MAVCIWPNDVIDDRLGLCQTRLLLRGLALSQLVGGLHQQLVGLVELGLYLRSYIVHLVDQLVGLFGLLPAAGRQSEQRQI